MLLRIFELSDSINRVLAKENNKEHKKYHITTVEISKIDDLLKGLKGFFLATVTLSGDKYSTRSKTIPILHVLDKKVFYLDLFFYGINCRQKK